MENQLTNNANALRLFFTEDVYLVEDKSVPMPHLAVVEPVLESLVDSNSTAVNSAILQENASNAVDIAEKESKTEVKSVEIPQIIESPQSQKSFKFLGGNKKLVLILVNDSHNDVSSEQGRELLRKIVKAVNLSTPDFALLNYANYNGTSFAEFKAFFKPQLLLSFGVENLDLQLNLNWQNEIIVHESTRMIFAPNLHQLDSDMAGKKSLWACLQKI